MRVAALLCIAVLAGCSREPATDAAAAAQPGAAQDIATSVSGGNTGTQGAGAGLLRRFLQQDGQEIEACFKDMPVLQGPSTATFDGPGAEAAPGRAGQVVLAIDASGSMAARVGGQTKMQAAKDAASAFLADVPAGVPVGLVAFGHRGSNREEDKAASCAAVESVYALGTNDRARIDAALRTFNATGWTPLAAAIEQAGRALGPTQDDTPRAVYVVSDGEDTCGGDPVAAARTLHAGGVNAIVNIIGFDLAPADRAQLKAVADAGGGTFVEVSAAKAASLGDELRRSNRNFSERLRASNRNFASTLQNDNRTFAARLKLSNCVNGGVLRESNDAYDFRREQTLTPADAAAFEAAVADRHAQYKARVQAYTEATGQARDAANADVERAQAEVEREAEAAQ